MLNAILMTVQLRLTHANRNQTRQNAMTQQKKLPDKIAKFFEEHCRQFCRRQDSAAKSFRTVGQASHSEAL
jgi:hypothetical protein